MAIKKYIIAFLVLLVMFLHSTAKRKNRPRMRAVCHLSIVVQI
nr:MAG TPA: hypothetical protein [Bacteriophage sp.]